MTLINLTPHRITIIDAEWRLWHFDPLPEDDWLRVTEKRHATGWKICVESGEPADDLHVPVNTKRFDRVGASGVPDRVPGVFYIVSTVVAQAFPERDDFLVPDEIERDEFGRIIGCRSLARVVSPDADMREAFVAEAMARAEPQYDNDGMREAVADAIARAE